MDYFLILVLVSVLLFSFLMVRHLLTILLVNTCREGDVARFKKLMAVVRSFPFNISDNAIIINCYDGSGLREAIKHKHTEIWEDLLNNPDVNPNLTDDQKETALHTACRWGNSRAAAKLVAMDNVVLNGRDKGWFGGSNDNYTYPTSILYLDNGFLIVLERSQINIYDKEAKLVQKLSGKYNGLAKDPHGNFISSNQKEDGTTFITVIGQMNGHGIYGVKDSFPLDITRKQESKVRFLAVHGGKIYASDYALNSIYVVDMETRILTTWDLNLSSPCGLLLDDRGYVLVADSGNNRLILLNGDGELFREISLKEKNALCPSDFVKVRGKSSDGVEENHIVVTYTGGDGTDGRLVRLKCT